MVHAHQRGLVVVRPGHTERRLAIAHLHNEAFAGHGERAHGVIKNHVQLTLHSHNAGLRVTLAEESQHRLKQRKPRPSAEQAKCMEIARVRFGRCHPRAEAILPCAVVQGPHNCIPRGRRCDAWVHWEAEVLRATGYFAPGVVWPELVVQYARFASAAGMCTYHQVIKDRCRSYCHRIQCELHHTT